MRQYKRPDLAWGTEQERQEHPEGNSRWSSSMQALPSPTFSLTRFDSPWTKLKQCQTALTLSKRKCFTLLHREGEKPLKVLYLFSWNLAKMLLKTITLPFKIFPSATWPHTWRSTSAAGIIQNNAPSASSDVKSTYGFKFKGLTAINTKDN